MHTCTHARRRNSAAASPRRHGVARLTAAPRLVLHTHTHTHTHIHCPTNRKTCDRPVDEDLRATIKAFCTGLVSALNKYYAFGSVFAEEGG
jgi:hypothetical protein